MAESLFSIFSDNMTRQAVKNVSRQPLSNIENMGKTVSTGPVKPNEPIKKGAEPKKSFLANTGKTLQSTPARQVFSPRTKNVASFIYSDADLETTGFSKAELEFTKPTYKYDNYHRDMIDFLPMPEIQFPVETSPKTPSPVLKRHDFDLSSSYEDDFFTDDYSIDSMPEEDLGLPSIY